MKDDPIEKKIRELSWRRELTEAELATLRNWLAAHPEVQADWEAEARLSALLSRLPDVPVSSNFTARVLQAVESSHPVAAATARPVWWWRVFLPRSAAAALILGLGLVALQQHETAHRKKMAQSLSMVAGAETLSNPALLQDFDTIRRLTPAAAPDKDLLALLQ